MEFSTVQVLPPMVSGVRILQLRKETDSTALDVIRQLAP